MADDQLLSKQTAPTKGHRPSRFLWGIAGADADLLLSPEMPRTAGIKYATIGTAIVAMAAIAAGGWGHIIISLLGTTPHRYVIAAATGTAMACFLGVMERVLIVSISPDLSLRGKALAFLGRSSIAILDATIVALPLILGWYDDRIGLRLDHQKLAELRTASETIKALVPRESIEQTLKELDAKLEQIRVGREQLPPEILDLKKTSGACEVEYLRLQNTDQKKIDRAQSELAWLRRASPSEVQYDIGARMRTEDRNIRFWQHELAADSTKCADLRVKVDDAVKKFLALWNDAYRRALEQRQEAELSANALKDRADGLLHESTVAIETASKPTVGAQIDSLIGMMHEDVSVRVVVALIVAFFAAFDLMPLMAKILNSGPYEYAVAARHRIVRAQMKASAEIQEARYQGKVEAAAAELAGFRNFRREAEGGLYTEHARNSALAKVGRAAIWARFDEMEQLCLRVEDGYRRIDELAMSLHGEAGAREVLEELRRLQQSIARSTAQDLCERKSADAAADDEMTAAAE